MKTYKCEYLRALPGEDDCRRSKIEAESPRAAYLMFLEEHGKHPYDVIVKTGMLSTEQFFDHIEEAKLEATQDQAVQAQKAAMLEASEVKRQAMHTAATKDAEASLASTDMLLKQLIAKQDETNQWLRKIRWSLLIISIIVALWYGFGWIIYPIR